MAAKKTGKLKVITSGTRNYIPVPSGQANALHQFLLSHRLPIFPPQPSSTDVDTINLGRGLDIKIVQDLLDKYS